MRLRFAGLLCVSAFGACGSPAADNSSAGGAEVLGPRGFGPIHLDDTFTQAKHASSFELTSDAGAFRPCRTFDAPTKAVYGLTQSDAIRVVGTRSPRVATDKGLRVGMTLDDAKRRYGDPHHFTTAPYDPSGSDILWRIGTLDGKPVWLRAIVLKQKISVLEVGHQPEVQFEESCA